MTPDLEALEATWPPAARTGTGPWTIRDGAGGGKRVSAATARAPVGAADIPMAEEAMRALCQTPLFRIGAGQDALDALLAARGYATIDPTVILAAPLDALCLPPPPRLTAIPAWPPLTIQRELWAASGIGPARLAVMDRAPGHKTALLARLDDRPAGTAFVALHEGTAMVHALEIVPHVRRRGLGRLVMAGAVHWARAAGADRLALAVTRGNAPALALYASLGLLPVGQYHYRSKEAPEP